MSKNQKASGITNIINYDNSGNISFVSGSTTLMSVSSSGAVVLTGTMSGGTADSASYAYTASSAISAYTASSAVSASYVLNAVSASYAYTASSAINAFSASKSISSSYSDTASFANSFNVAGNLTASNAVLSGTLTAQTLVVQTITSSIDFVTGSTRFGSLLTNTHTFTGSIYQTGSIAAFAGSVGIGTTNPTHTIDVYGTGRFTGAINSVGVFSNGDSTVAASNQFQVSGVTNTNKQLLIGYNTTGNGFGSIQAIFQGTAYTPISLNPLGGNVGIGLTNPSYLLDVNGAGRFQTGGATGDMLIISASAGNYIKMGGISSGTTYLYSFENAFNIGNSYSEGSLRLFAGNSAKVTIASTGVSTFTVSGNDTRLANFSTTTYDSVRGLRINSYQSSNGGQDCAIEFDSGVGGYGGFKLSNSGTPMLTLIATGAATFSNDVNALSFTNTGQLAHLLNNAGVNNDFRMGSASSQFRIVNAANTAGLLTIDNAGAATFNSSIDVTTNGSFGFQDYRTQATQKVLVLRGEGVSGNYAPSLFNIYTKPGTTSNGIASLIIKSKYGSEAESGNLFEFKGNGEAVFGSNISANNIKILSFTLPGPGTPISTGLSINGYGGGRTYLLLTSQQWSDGNSTSATITMIRCGYDGNNFSAVVLGSSNATLETWSQSGGILYVTGNTNFQLDILVLSNG